MPRITRTDFKKCIVSGPIILSASSHLVRTKMINPKIIVDMKPALSAEKLEDRILRDFKKYQNKEIKNALNDLLPKKMIPVIIRKSNINFEKKVNEITKEERKQLINSIKNFTIEIEGFRSIDEAIITAGGVSINKRNKSKNNGIKNSERTLFCRRNNRRGCIYRRI